jgi:dihydromonapterin reductase/dihydrofolate reductase
MEQETLKQSAPTIFITGAGRRLGLYLVTHYLSQGWRVIAHYHSRNELAKARQDEYRRAGLYHSIQADLTQLADVENMMTQSKRILTQHQAQLDCLIHSASYFIADDDSSGLQQLWQHGQAMQAVHVLAPKLISHGLLPYMAQDSSIIAITDIYADLPNSRFASYCSAKAGLQNLALSLAQKLAPKIRVNVIQPGPIKFLPEHDQDYQARVLSQSLLKRELGYKEIQQGLDYLIAAKGVTGSILKVDGGRSCANRFEQLFQS